jgi:manganese/zinc/iron transport system permease protein
MPALSLGWSWALDGWIVMAGVLCAVAATLLGNFLVLRRLSMLGDAVSHAVLPGLAAAFFLTGSRASLPMFLGAVIVGILTAVFTEWVRSFGKVDEGASMGVVFTSLFALGLLMIKQAADRVDLDAGCVLYGSIELTTQDTVPVWGWDIPRAVLVLASVCLINAVAVALFYKEFKIGAFDPALATTLGISATGMHYLLMVLVAVTAVASFESVGNILVVAMFIVPPATARLLTHSLGPMIAISVVLAAAGACLGHLGAIALPRLFGAASTTTASMMAVAVGLFFGVALLVAPGQGVLTRLWQRRKLSRQILRDDVLAYLYRCEERDQTSAGTEEMRDELLARSAVLRSVLRRLCRRRLVLQCSPGVYQLTPAGRAAAVQLIRSHRLWEQYLHTEADLPPERLHDKAERLEHFTDRRLREQLDRETRGPERDPHGAIVPPDQRRDT